MTETTNTKHLTDSDFSESIKSGVSLIDFWAEWCIPCRMQTPILEKVHQAVGSKALIGKVNVDENMEVASEYGIISIPTLILFKDGKEVKRFVGVQNDAVLNKAIEDAI
ncbi:MAG: thioredoxin [Spirochaetales bacterium]|nr:thioredoxin [Spirochaetales bacterium]